MIEVRTVARAKYFEFCGTGHRGCLRSANQLSRTVNSGDSGTADLWHHQAICPVPSHERISARPAYIPEGQHSPRFVIGVQRESRASMVYTFDAGKFNAGLSQGYPDVLYAFKAP